VTAKATTPYSFDIPFVGTTISREVTERATMPCG
jgi:hypothetical protein